MTPIDTGMFTVDEIAVTNRQKMSGIRYGKGADFMVDAALNAAVERFRGNDADVIA